MVERLRLTEGHVGAQRRIETLALPVPARLVVAHAFGEAVIATGSEPWLLRRWAAREHAGGDAVDDGGDDRADLIVHFGRDLVANSLEVALDADEPVRGGHVLLVQLVAHGVAVDGQL